MGHLARAEALDFDPFSQVLVNPVKFRRNFLGRHDNLQFAFDVAEIFHLDVAV